LTDVSPELHPVEMDLADRFIGTRDGDLERWCRRDNREHPAAGRHQIIATFLDAGVKDHHVGAIARHLVQARDYVTGADVAGISMGGKDDAN